MPSYINRKKYKNVTDMENFSVCISVYKNDQANHVKRSLHSITRGQTLQPSEILLVVDGPIGNDIERVIKEEESAYPGLYNVIRFEKNQGLGMALQQGMLAAKNEIMMRMDSDDVASADRFEKQMAFMTTHKSVGVCGGQISEFIDDESNIVGRRTVPCDNSEIYKYMKTRCAFNHMTVALRRSMIMEVGNYQPWFWNEDYYLWVRLMISHCEFANLPDTLVNVRVGRDMYARRGGMKYFKSEAKLQKYMYNHRLIGGGVFVN